MIHNLTRTPRDPDPLTLLIHNLLEEEGHHIVLYVMGDPGFGAIKDNICIHSPGWRTNAYLYHRPHTGTIEIKANIPYEKIIFTAELLNPTSIDRLLEFVKGWKTGEAPGKEEEGTSYLQDTRTAGEERRRQRLLLEPEKEGQEGQEA